MEGRWEEKVVGKERVFQAEAVVQAKVGVTTM